VTGQVATWFDPAAQQPMIRKTYVMIFATGDSANRVRPGRPEEFARSGQPSGGVFVPATCPIGGSTTGTHGHPGDLRHDDDLHERWSSGGIVAAFQAGTAGRAPDSSVDSNVISRWADPAPCHDQESAGQSASAAVRPELIRKSSQRKTPRLRRAWARRRQSYGLSPNFYSSSLRGPYASVRLPGGFRVGHRLLRQRYFLICLIFCLILFIVGFVGINKAPSRSGLSYTMGWVIGLSLAGALLSLALFLRARRHSHT